MNWHPTFQIERELADMLEEQNPVLWKVCAPRRYLPPQGYANPRIHGTILAASTGMSPEVLAEDRAMIVCLASGWKLAEHGVPTYFVGSDFATALMMTEPPKDMTLADLKWPHEGLLFVLPEAFQKSYFGRPVPFLRAALLTGETARVPRSLGALHLPVQQISMTAYGGKREVFACSAPVYFGEKLVEYAGSYETGDSIEKVLNEQDFKMSIGFDEVMGRSIAREYSLEASVVTSEEDVQIVKKIACLAIQLLLAMTALPQHIQAESVARPARVKRGEVRDALWNPNVFGGAYVLDKPKTLGNGTHASPRLHRRRGHWHNYRHGPGRGMLKLKWTQPYWVGA